ncbi:MAG TPA: LCP family protein [Actinomycetota bacterium]
MKSLEELIEEIKREARGEPPEEARLEAPVFEAPGPASGPAIEPEVFEAYEEWEPWLLAEVELQDEPRPAPQPEPEPVEPEPPLEPEPPIVEPRPPLPDEPEEDDEDAGAAGAAPTETDPDELDFDHLLNLVGGPPAPAREDLRPARPPLEPEFLETEPLETEPMRTLEAPSPEPLPEPVPEARLRPRAAKGLRYGVLGLGILAFVIGATIWLAGPAPDRDARPSGVPVGTAGDQRVVAWSVWDGQTSEGAFVTIVTLGGGKPPVALSIPSYTMVNIPGYGTAAVGDAIAAEGGDRGAVAVENLLGIGIDASAFSTLDDLRRTIDELGGITIGETTMSGEESVQYLMRGGADSPISAEFQFLRWQELVAGMLDAVNGRTEVFTSLGPEVGPVLAAAGSAGAEVLELPVVDIGAGLARPDAEEVQRIVEQRFLPTARTTRTVRLSVLNGVGTPGVGERVSKILGPAGFKLVASGNAQTFDFRETQIIATTEEFLPESELARDLLGVGKVYVSAQPSGLVDVTVIVGSDFGGT